jgi:hypothetical protein
MLCNRITQLALLLRLLLGGVCRSWYSGATYSYNTNYTNWGDNQPDNFADDQGLSMALLLDNQLMWDDYYHFMYQEFVCEQKVLP